jgi:hypothetical protein
MQNGALAWSDLHNANPRTRGEQAAMAPGQAVAESNSVRHHKPVIEGPIEADGADGATRLTRSNGNIILRSGSRRLRIASRSRTADRLDSQLPRSHRGLPYHLDRIPPARPIRVSPRRSECPLLGRGSSSWFLQALGPPPCVAGFA